jgi:hypothetical protein
MSRTHHHSKRHWKGLKKKLWDDGGWAKREPKEWRKLMKHRPRRARTREAEQKALHEPEEAVFPLDSKPWIWYY